MKRDSSLCLSPSLYTSSPLRSPWRLSGIDDAPSLPSIFTLLLQRRPRRALKKRKIRGGRCPADQQTDTDTVFVCSGVVVQDTPISSPQCSLLSLHYTTWPKVCEHLIIMLIITLMCKQLPLSNFPPDFATWLQRLALIRTEEHQYDGVLLQAKMYKIKSRGEG